MRAPDDPWPVEALMTERLELEPLRVEHAAEMVMVLADGSLYRWTGGRPEDEDALAERYGRQVRGHSADGEQWWFNWVLRERVSGKVAGYVQATVVGRQRSLAEVAWVVSPAYQRQGLAREAATAMVAWLYAHGVGTVFAHIHREHAASAAVARAIELRPTDELVDGEVRWTSDG